MNSLAGTTRFVPAVFFALVIAMALPLVSIPGGAPPAEARDKDRFTEPGQEPERELGPLEKAVERVAVRARSRVGLPDSEDAVRFLLYLQAEAGHDPGSAGQGSASSSRGSKAHADLNLATAMARRLSGSGGGAGSPQMLYQLAQSGAGTLGEAEALMTRRAEFMGMSDRATTDTYASFVRDLLARAAALHDQGQLLNALLAAGDLFEALTRRQGGRLIVLPGGNQAETSTFSDHLEMLRTAVAATQASGSPLMRTDVARLGHEIIRNFWSDEDARFHLSPHEGQDPVLTSLLNVRAALALWEAGWLSGDALLTGRGRRVLDGMLAEALREPLVAPTAALAAGRMGGHPVQMVLVGAPGDPTLIELRRECFFIPEPRRLLLTLDPMEDAARLEELGYPTEISPALFICVGVICSAPIQTADGLENSLREILALAAEAQP